MYKLPAVAEYLGVSLDTARRYVRSGEIPSTFIGGAYRVEEEDLKEFIESRRSKSPKAQAQPSKDEAQAALPQGSDLEALYKEAVELTSHAKELRESGNFFPEVPDAEPELRLIGMGRAAEFAWQADHCRLRAYTALEAAEKEETEQLHQALEELSKAKMALMSDVGRTLERLELQDHTERQAQEYLGHIEAAPIEDAKAE